MRLALFSLVLCTSIAKGDGLKFGEDWTTSDTVRQGAVTALLIADWAQTKWIVRHGAKSVDESNIYNVRIITFEDSYETNPLLGRHPSAGRTDVYFAAVTIGHAAVSYMLPRGWREGWQYIWIGVEANQVNRNRAIGVKMTF